MATPAPAPKILFLFLLSLVILCFTGVFIKNQEAAPMEEEEHQTFLSSRRQLIPYTILRFLDSTPTASPQVTVSPTPPLVTVPSSTPVPAAPSPPTTLPPPTLPPPTLPPPAASTPVTTNPPASNTNPAVTPPAASGQSWCVARAGAPAASVQAALDYACGAGADCGAIQQSGACFNPNTLQNHASYAFSSFYQKHSGQSGSCNFNGVAETTIVNPSSGSCGYPTLSSSTSPTTTPPTPTTPMTPTPAIPTPATPTPVTQTPATPTTTTPPSSSGFAAPPNIFNGINPPLGSGSTGFGLNPPTTSSTSSTSVSVSLQHTFISCIVLVSSIITVLGI